MSTYASHDPGFTPPRRVEDLIALLEPHRGGRVFVDFGKDHLGVITDVITYSDGDVCIDVVARS